MPDTHTTSVDQQRLEKERIEDDGTVTLTRGGHAIHCLTVIGQVEGHTEAPQGQKTTKYEHVIPQLAAVQEDPRIEGLLVLLNTVGGDVEAGLALAELIGVVRRKEDLVCLQRPAHRLFVKGHRVQPGIHAGQVTESLCLIGHLDGSAVEDIQKVFAHQIFLIEARRRRDLGYHLLFIVQLFHTSSVPFIKKGRQTLHPTPIILKTAVFCWLSAAIPYRVSVLRGWNF